jgi:hypothetical protein
MIETSDCCDVAFGALELRPRSNKVGGVDAGGEAGERGGRGAETATEVCVRAVDINRRRFQVREFNATTLQLSTRKDPSAAVRSEARQTGTFWERNTFTDCGSEGMKLIQLGISEKAPKGQAG